MKKVLKKFSQFYKNLPIAKKMATTIIFILALFFVCCHRIDHGHIF